MIGKRLYEVFEFLNSKDFIISINNNEIDFDTLVHFYNKYYRYRCCWCYMLSDGRCCIGFDRRC